MMLYIGGSSMELIIVLVIAIFLAVIQDNDVKTNCGYKRQRPKTDRPKLRRKII